MPVNRDSMTIVGNDLRATNSPAYITESLYKQAQETGKNCIIESVRNPLEIEGLKKQVEENTDKRYELQDCI